MRLRTLEMGVWSVCEWLWMTAGARVGALKGRNGILEQVRAGGDGDSRVSIVLVVADASSCSDSRVRIAIGTMRLVDVTSGCV
jgi:hypothetical protein